MVYNAICLKPSREMNEVRTDTKSGSRTSSDTHAGDVCIEDAECCRSRQRNEDNLLHVQRTLGDRITGD